jgi:hypothetical protein
MPRSTNAGPLAKAFDGGKVQERVDLIVTAGKDVLAEARQDGVLTPPEASGVKVLMYVGARPRSLSSQAERGHQ